QARSRTPLVPDRSDAKHAASASASWAFSDDMKSSIAFGKCTDMVILLLSACIRRLRTGWSSACKWQERTTTNFAGQTDLPAIGKSNPGIELRQINATGKSLLIFRNGVKPRNQKYFASPPTQIRCISPTSCPTEGRCARHETRAGMRWTRRRQASNSEPDEECRRVRPSRVVLTPQCRRQACEKKRRRRCQQSMVT